MSHSNFTIKKKRSQQTTACCKKTQCPILAEPGLESDLHVASNHLENQTSKEMNAWL